jgi:O-antigen polymerase
MLGALQTAWVIIRYEREGLRNPMLLLEVRNPLAWKTRFEYHVQHLRLNAAIASHDVPEIEGYINWARDFVDRAPRPDIYANIVLALDALGRRAEAAETRARGLQLFPTDPNLLRHSKRENARPELPPWARSP